MSKRVVCNFYARYFVQTFITISGLFIIVEAKKHCVVPVIQIADRWNPNEIKNTHRIDLRILVIVLSEYTLPTLPAGTYDTGTPQSVCLVIILL